MNIKKRLIITLIVSSLFLLATLSAEAADETIYDSINDVASMNDLTEETTVVTEHPDIQVDNLDIVNATYTKTGMTATVTLQVKGSIENRGKIEEPDPSQLDFNINNVEYMFQVVTSTEQYNIIYSNYSGQITDNNDVTNLTSSNFSIINDNTLSITFTLKSSDETYTSLSVVSTYIKADLTENESNFVYLSDVAPNPPLEIFEAYAPNVGSDGEEIQFNGSIYPFTGQPPYAYEWNFGDGETSNEQNPTHIYTKAGSFTYNFTITDQSEATAYETGTITITQEGGSTGRLSTQMILFLAVLLIIIVVGVVVIVMIIRR